MGSPLVILLHTIILTRGQSPCALNIDNMIAIPRDVHRKISGYYSSKPEDLGGLRVRDWLNGQSYEKQYEFGLEVLKKYGY